MLENVIRKISNIKNGIMEVETEDCDIITIKEVESQKYVAECKTNPKYNGSVHVNPPSKVWYDRVYYPVERLIITKEGNKPVSVPCSHKVYEKLKYKLPAF